MVRFDDAFFKDFYEKLALGSRAKERGYLEWKAHNYNTLQLVKKVNRIKRDKRKLVEVIEYLVEKNKILTKEIYDLRNKH